MYIENFIPAEEGEEKQDCSTADVKMEDVFKTIKALTILKILSIIKKPICVIRKKNMRSTEPIKVKKMAGKFNNKEQCLELSSNAPLKGLTIKFDKNEEAEFGFFIDKFYPDMMDGIY